MSNLWTTEIGRAAVKEGVYDVLRRRLGRYYGRKFEIQFDQWIQSGKTAFSFVNVLGQLNDARDPELLGLYELLMAIGEATVTWDDLDIYISQTGSDINGLGTVESPFRRVSHALNMLRNTRIEHHVRILVPHTELAVQTVYPDDVLYVGHEIVGGTLNVIGVGLALETKAAQVLTAVTALGAGGYEFSVGGVPWIADDWIGEYMIPDDGPGIGVAFPISTNDTSNLYSRYGGVIPVIGNTVRGFVPGVKIQLNKLTIEHRGLGETSLPDYRNSSVSFCNVELDFRDTNEAYNTCMIKGTEQEIWLDFVVFTFVDGASYDSLMANCWVNVHQPFYEGLNAASQAGITNIGEFYSPGITCARVTKALDGSTVMLNVDDGNIYNLTMPERLRTNGPFHVNCAVASLESVGGRYVVLTRILFSNDGLAAAVLESTAARIGKSYIMNGLNGIVAQQAQINLRDDTECDPLLAGAALEAGVGTFVDTNGALANFIGAGGSILFTAPNPDVPAAWPGAGVIVGDAIGGAGVHSAWVVQPG